MVIIIPKTKGTEEAARSILSFFKKLWLYMLLFSSPIQFMGGLSEIFYGNFSVLEGLALAATGLVIMVPTIIYGIVKEIKMRKLGERFLTVTKLSIISLVGIGEIIGGLAIPYDGTMEYIRLMLVGGGVITFLPAAIYSIVVINQNRRVKQLQPLTEPPKYSPEEPLTPSNTKPVSLEDSSDEDLYTSLDKKTKEN